jgi:hypothetical protein
MIHNTVLVLALAGCSFAQSAPPSGLTVWFVDGTTLEIHTASSGANAPLSTSGSDAVANGNTYHRIVSDKDSVLLGYDIVARKSRTEADTFAIRIRPIDTSQAGLGGNGKWLPIPTINGVREFPPLKVGDAVQVDILYHPVTKERIYDVIKVLKPRSPSVGLPRIAGRRLSLQEVRITVNGKSVREPDGSWMVGGAIMLHLSGHGDFYFTLAPPQDFPFEARGWVDHTTLKFRDGADLIEITGKSNVLQDAETGPVWVYHDPQPPPSPGLSMSCADDMASLLHLNGLPTTGAMTVKAIDIDSLPADLKARVKEKVTVREGDTLSWSDLAGLSKTLRGIDERLNLGISAGRALTLRITRE